MSLSTSARPDRESPGSVIQFQDVSWKSPEGKTIIRDLSFDVPRGETLVFLGRSGSGKTTTLKMINRLLDPAGGEVRVDGIRTTDWDVTALRRRLGYVIQEIGLFPHFTVEKNVALIPRLLQWSPERVQARTREVLSWVDLDPEEFLQRFPRELSGGQRQRVGVARALAADPEILLMDEPFGALDPVTRTALQQEFALLVRRLHKTIIFVTHDVREALWLGSRIGLMQSGQFVFLDSAEAFLSSPLPEVMAFVDSGRMKPVQ
ncbi:MAG: ATP-binding cassette domain-containing protein [Acidobacteriia bacterium]|nr:ATP-binding cassette domain-containing protein [Terriglobia bacterium]